MIESGLKNCSLINVAGPLWPISQYIHYCKVKYFIVFPFYTNNGSVIARVLNIGLCLTSLPSNFYLRCYRNICRELRCLRHKIHIGLFISVILADLSWLIEPLLQVECWINDIMNMNSCLEFHPDRLLCFGDKCVMCHPGHTSLFPPHNFLLDVSRRFAINSEILKFT